MRMWFRIPYASRPRRVLLLFDTLILIIAIGVVWRLVGRNDSGERGFLFGEIIQPGSQLRLEGVDCSARPRCVVILVSPGCPACGESLNFYRQLFEYIQGQRDARLILLAAEPEEQVRDWFGASHASGHAVVRLLNPQSVGFFLVPTLLFINEHGVVTDLFAEKLDPEEEDFVWRKLKGEVKSSRGFNNAPAPRRIGSDEFADARKRSKVTVIDVRSRQAYQRRGSLDATNIPADELAVRARIELPLAGLVIIDCSSLPSSACRSAGFTLTSIGFRDVMLFIP